jgi:hypothetical protein
MAISSSSRTDPYQPCTNHGPEMKRRRSSRSDAHGIRDTSQTVGLLLFHHIFYIIWTIWVVHWCLGLTRAVSLHVWLLLTARSRWPLTKRSLLGTLRSQAPVYCYRSDLSRLRICFGEVTCHFQAGPRHRLVSDSARRQRLQNLWTSFFPFRILLYRTQNTGSTHAGMGL